MDYIRIPDLQPVALYTVQVNLGFENVLWTWSVKKDEGHIFMMLFILKCGTQHRDCFFFPQNSAVYRDYSGHSEIMEMGQT